MNQVLESGSSETMHTLSQLAINELLARYGYPFISIVMKEPISRL